MHTYPQTDTYVHTYIHAYIHTYRYQRPIFGVHEEHIHTHIHTYTYIHIQIHTYMYIKIHIHTNTYKYIHVPLLKACPWSSQGTTIYIPKNRYMHTYPQTDTYIHRYIYTYATKGLSFEFMRRTHTYIHTYIPLLKVDLWSS